MKYLITITLALMTLTLNAQTIPTSQDSTVKQIILEPIGTMSDTTTVVAVIVDKLNTPLVAKEYKVINRWYQYKTPDNNRIRGSEPFEQTFYDPTTKVSVDAKKLQNKILYIQLMSEWKK